MKNSNFGQGKRVPAQFSDYLSLLAGADAIFHDLVLKIESTMFDYYRSLPQSEIEYDISELVVKQYIKQLRMKFLIVLDKFDLYMKEKFEDHYINYRRVTHKKQMKQYQKKIINLDNYHLFTKQCSNIDDKLTKEFQEYFDAFFEKLDTDTGNYLESILQTRSEISLNGIIYLYKDEFEKTIQNNEVFISNKIN